MSIFVCTENSKQEAARFPSCPMKVANIGLLRIRFPASKSTNLKPLQCDLRYYYKFYGSIRVRVGQDQHSGVMEARTPPVFFHISFKYSIPLDF